MESLPVAFIAAAVAMLMSQVIKILAPVFRGRPPVLKNALQAGGMPSAHTAASAAMAITVGLREGFGSSIFAVAAVLTGVVAHDAVKVRGTLNTVIKILKETASEETLEKAGGMPDTVGHSVAEVAAGFILAIGVALLCSSWLH